MLIIDTQTGRILGATPDAGYTRQGCALHQEPEGFDMSQSDEWSHNGTSLVHDPLAATTRAKSNRISQIKTDAAKQIESLAWRIERAKERELLGVAGERVNEVLLEREAIRRASSRCEAEVNAALDAASASAVVFSVTEADRTTPERISRVEFLNRFTDTEMQAFIAASKTTPALEAYFLKLQNAEGVMLADPVTMGGVQALELMGIVGTGRAAVILAV